MSRCGVGDGRGKTWMERRGCGRMRLACLYRCRARWIAWSDTSKLRRRFGLGTVQHSPRAQQATAVTSELWVSELTRGSISLATRYVELQWWTSDACEPGKSVTAQKACRSVSEDKLEESRHDSGRGTTDYPKLRSTRSQPGSSVCVCGKEEGLQASWVRLVWGTIECSKAAFGWCAAAAVGATR